MNRLRKGELTNIIEPCPCGQTALVNGKRMSIHLARLYYRKWVDEGFEEDKSNVED
jgi:hypothetical protein